MHYRSIHAFLQLLFYEISSDIPVPTPARLSLQPILPLTHQLK